MIVSPYSLGIRRQKVPAWRFELLPLRVVELKPVALAPASSGKDSLAVKARLW
jgi:hypothetical protein